ncbi:pectinesterase family protein [Sphingobacterium paludis]|jgi:pectinesterase|uniref:Pectinesterase n=1 Tax=Sphingobacterium paludis TaxID=1476465 RepID=A0A4R7D421_9SPHI|nr:pectinesterase family protein [Sphingobacterium paludis]TDS14881.1 pectinesterase [Sphingobacterium paludis]
MIKYVSLLLLCALFFVQNSWAKDYDFVVAKDGSGQFTTVQAAIDAVPSFRKETTTIFIKKGIYKEKIILSVPKQHIKLVGEDVSATILTFDDYAQRKNLFGEDIGTSGSASFYCLGDNFTAENISFENSAGPVGQAVALWVAADKATFINCRFLGFQDTLYTYGKGARQLYVHCYIEGTVDYIFGSSTAWFEGCELHCKNSGYITAASTPETSSFGYIFNNCTITGSPDVQTFYLGRPWRPYAKVVFMHSSIPAFISKAGWDNWGKASNEQTAFFAEYHNTGAGALSQSRVKWAKQLSTQEAENISLTAVFGDWQVDLPSADHAHLR